MTKNIAVLDFNTYEVKLYSNVQLELNDDIETEDEAVIEFLDKQGHNESECQYMYGDEPMNIDTSNWDNQI